MTEADVETAPEAVVDPSRRRTCLIVVLAMAVGVVIVDHVVKAWVGGHEVGETFASFLGGFVKFTYIENSGAAFSIGAGYTWIFTIVAVVVAVVILRTSRRLGSIWWAIALGGLLGGLLGNLVDRLYDPALFLSGIASRVLPGGLLVITSPYTWLEEYTPKAKWLGGRREHGEPLTTFAGLSRSLAGSFTLLHRQDVPFVIRETARKHQHTIAELTVWRCVQA